MCGRFTLTDPDRLERAYGKRFGFAEFSEYRLPRFNVAPAQAVLGVRNDGARSVEPLWWGIHGRINARAQTVALRGERHRCIVFADGFYEWQNRKPTYFTLKTGEPFAFAGVWSTEGEGARCAIITCEANDAVRPIHDRMPVILPDDALDVWLAQEELPSEVVRSLLRPLPAGAMAARTVSRRLNDARYDAPDVLVDDDPVQPSLGF